MLFKTILSGFFNHVSVKKNHCVLIGLKAHQTINAKITFKNETVTNRIETTIFCEIRLVQSKPVYIFGVLIILVKYNILGTAVNVSDHQTTREKDIKITNYSTNEHNIELSSCSVSLVISRAISL